jgi:hypothetical protein
MAKKKPAPKTLDRFAAIADILRETATYRDAIENSSKLSQRRYGEVWDKLKSVFAVCGFTSGQFATSDQIYAAMAAVLPLMNDCALGWVHEHVIATRAMKVAA